MRRRPVDTVAAVAAAAEAIARHPNLVELIERVETVERGRGHPVDIYRLAKLMDRMDEQGMGRTSDDGGRTWRCFHCGRQDDDSFGGCPCEQTRLAELNRRRAEAVAAARQRWRR